MGLAFLQPPAWLMGLFGCASWSPTAGGRAGKASREAVWPRLVQRLELELLLRWTWPAKQPALWGRWGGRLLELAGVKKCSSTCHPSQPAAQSFPCRIFTREAAICLLCSQGRIDDFSQIPKRCSTTFPKPPSYFFSLMEKILQLPLQRAQARERQADIQIP